MSEIKHCDGNCRTAEIIQFQAKNDLHRVFPCDAQEHHDWEDREAVMRTSTRSDQTKAAIMFWAPAVASVIAFVLIVWGAS